MCRWNNTPIVTVVMPVYNSRTHLAEAIESIRSQTFPDWEMLVINEYGSRDGSAEVIDWYQKKDNRIVFIQNQEKLRLAESLNKGIRMAQGSYIARMDADDLSDPTRLEKQVQYLEQHPEIGLCGTYQHHFGANMNWIHKPAVSPEACKANLMFDCDLCHSTVMFRKDCFLQHQLFYNPCYLAEDFELWTRAVREIKFANIPEVLGKYRWDGTNISIQKKEQLAKENAVIVANALKRNLGMIVPKEEYCLLEGWGNPFLKEKDRARRKKMYQKLQELLTDIYYCNRQQEFYQEQALLSILASKWRYVRYGEPRNIEREITSIDEIFDPSYRPDYRMMWRTYRERRTGWREDIRKIWNYLKR